MKLLFRGGFGIGVADARGRCSKVGMLRLRRSSASLHSGSALHDTSVVYQKMGRD